MEDIFYFILICVLFTIFSNLFIYFVGNIRYSKYRKMSYEKKQVFIDYILENKEYDESLIMASSRNTIGTTFYTVFTYNYRYLDKNYKEVVCPLNLKAKCFCVLFIPISTYGYILTTENDKVIATLSTELFTKKIIEILYKD